MESASVKPQSLRREGAGLRIDWSDSTSTFVSWRTLRRACPCASCLEERNKPADPFRILSDTEVAAGDPQPKAMKPVGHYPYQITWADGHDTGIYTLQTLKTLDETPP